MTWKILAPVALILLPGWVGPAAAELLDVPVPALEALEEGVREQLTSARDRLDQLRADPATPEGELGLAFGQMGQLYYLYDLTGAAQPCLLNAEALEPRDPRWSYYLGVLHQLDGGLEQAQEQFERVLSIKPDELATQIRLADVHLDLGNTEAALEIFERHLEGPAAAAALYGAGRVAEYSREPEVAITYFERALTAQPTANGIHHRLGMAYRQLRNLDKAREHLELNRGERVRFPDPLIDGLSQLLRASQVFFKAGVDALKRGDYDEAVVQLLRAREDKGGDPIVHYNLALAYMGRNEDQLGEASLRKSIEVDPGFRNGHFNLGQLMAEQNRLPEAEVAFRRAFEIDPLDTEAHREWATALAATGNLPGARTEFEKVLEAHPGDVEARLNLSALLMQQGDPRGSLEHLERASADGSTEADLRRASLLERGGRGEAALEAWAEAVRKEPESADVQEQRALALGRAGRFAEAALAFDAAVGVEGSRMSAHMGRALSYLLADDDRSARTSLEASVVALPDELQLSHLLARLLVASAVDEVRDGVRGLELASAALEAGQSAEYAQTLAMAFAEVGRFEDAVDLQQQVIDRMGAGAQAVDSRPARARLELYKRGEPCRAPWKNG